MKLMNGGKTEATLPVALCSGLNITRNPPRGGGDRRLHDGSLSKRKRPHRRPELQISPKPADGETGRLSGAALGGLSGGRRFTPPYGFVGLEVPLRTCCVTFFFS